jgi:hypothetical protein
VYANVVIERAKPLARKRGWVTHEAFEHVIA